MKNIIFGPVQSRRFGRSLGVDLSPSKKQCNFDCLYCELEAAKTINHYDDTVALHEVVDALKEALLKHNDLDFITLTANGEPTLYPYLDALVEAINLFKGEIKTLILSNGSTIMNPAIQKTLATFDTVKLSLDCVNQRCLKKLDRVHNGISIDEIMQGMLEFKKHYKGDLIIEILFVKDINDRDIAPYNQFLLKLQPVRIDIGTIDRPPAYDVKPLSYEELLRLAQAFEVTLPVYIASRKNVATAPSMYTQEEILATLSKRPLTDEDIAILMDVQSQKLLQRLLEMGQIEKIRKNGLIFYKIAKLS